MTGSVLEQLTGDPRAAEALAWVTRWWWLILVGVALVAVFPRRSR